MARKHILHMLTPLKHMSPFDVNMALDAGFDAVVPYVGVSLGEVTGLVQDAIFSRPPDAGVDTGIFIAGKDVSLALDMFDAAKKAMVPPFQVSVFADPAGSFTTAAAMVAKVEKTLRQEIRARPEGYDASRSSAPPAWSASAPPSSPPGKAPRSHSSAMTASSGSRRSPPRSRAGSASRSMPPTARPTLGKSAVVEASRSDPDGCQGRRSGDLEGAT